MVYSSLYTVNLSCELVRRRVVAGTCSTWTTHSFGGTSLAGETDICNIWIGERQKQRDVVGRLIWDMDIQYKQHLASGEHINLPDIVTADLSSSFAQWCHGVPCCIA